MKYALDPILGSYFPLKKREMKERKIDKKGLVDMLASLDWVIDFTLGNYFQKNKIKKTI